MIAADDLDGLRPAWLRLWDADPRATPFTHPDWMIAWWRRFGSGTPLALTAIKGAELASLLPLYRPAESPATATALGAGLSDAFDLVGRPPPAETLAAALRGAGLGRTILAAVPDGSPLLALRLPGWRRQIAVDTVSPTLTLPDGIAETMRARLAYERRRAARAGGFAVETVGADGLAAWFDALLRLHGARWAMRGEHGVLAHPAVRGFHRDVVTAFASAGLLRAYLLRIAGKIAASYYGFAAKGASFYYIAGFDPDAARLSPGVLLIGHAIDEAAREGATCFHFLRGGESYKYRWGARDHSLFSITWALDAR